MNRIAIAAATLVLVLGAIPAEAGIRKNGTELNGIRRGGAEGRELATPSVEGIVLRDGAVILPAER